MDIHERTIEAVKETLDEYGQILSEELVEEIVCTVEGCYENASLMSMPVENPLIAEIDRIKQNHKKEIKEHEEIELIYRNSVAIRRNIAPSDVYIENKSVMYRP